MTAEEVTRTAGLIRAINQNVTLIVIDHDMAFIRMIADTVTVFHQGAILLEEPVAKALADQRVRDIYLGKKIK
jgi:branched-chain amino acid transport system ATP-binding protein/urea transport system ATP-binding protein